MARGRSKSLDTLSLVHGEGGVEEVLVVKVVHREEACLAVVELTYIARVVHARAVLNASNGHLFDFLHRKIEERPVVTIVGVAVKINGKGLIIRA